VDTNKQNVYEFWNESSCGENLYLSDDDCAGYISHASARYNLEGDIIIPFAKFAESKGMRVLEIGVGLGADHQQFAESGAILTGIDITEKAIEHTSKRFSALGLSSDLSVNDAEMLNFSNGSFELVYSWGVLHHSPNTVKAISEVYRVLKKDGIARIMIYHKWSIVGYMLWFRYALLRLKPWISLNEIYSKYLESPGTKAYSVSEAMNILSNIGFLDIEISTPLGHGDLLESAVGQRHEGVVLSLVKKCWPRWFFRLFMKNSGIFMLISAKK